MMRSTNVGRIIDAVDDVLYVIREGDEGTLYLWNGTLAETTGYDHDEIATMRPKEFIPPDQHEYVPGLMEAISSTRDRRVEVDILTKDGERVAHEFKGTTFEDPETGRAIRCGLARDVTERSERELKRRRDELETLVRINELLLATTRELAQAASRDALERTVCDRLASADRYRWAWIGERSLDDDRVVPRASAGLDGDVSDVVNACNLASRALATGAVEVGDADAPPPELPGDGAVVAVPLYRDDTVYGVLVIRAAEVDAFDEREVDGLEALGAAVGAVIHATRSRDLLFADAVVELEFAVEGDLPFEGVAATLDCDLELDGYVASGERWVLYLDVDGASPDAVAGALAERSRVARAGVVGGPDGGRVEVTVTESSLLGTVTAVGGTLPEALVTPSGGRLVVEAPAEADVRVVADHVRDTYGGADLVARRERDREVTTVGRPGGLLDELTERQREALEVAYRSGYFAWPRESTAEEVADALDLAPATLHGHLRKAEERLLERLFEARADGG
jgi:PAS domain S-box-containing protein